MMASRRACITSRLDSACSRILEFIVSRSHASSWSAHWAVLEVAAAVWRTALSGHFAESAVLSAIAVSIGVPRYKRGCHASRPTKAQNRPAKDGDGRIDQRVPYQRTMVRTYHWDGSHQSFVHPKSECGNSRSVARTSRDGDTYPPATATAQLPHGRREGSGTRRL